MRVGEMVAGPRYRFVRRLVLMLLFLVLFDRIADVVLHRVEHQRYEVKPNFRFANNDLFSLGPMVRYLREKPKGERRRIVFMGNSMMYGYLLRAEEAVPGQFERQAAGPRVFNASMNGAELGTSYLVAKTILGSVDQMFIQLTGQAANPLIAPLIPIEAEDARAFALEQPHAVERHSRAAVARVWRLYDVNDRLQAALFGTSTRQFMYANKRDIALWFLQPVYKPPPFQFPPVPEPVPPMPLLRVPRLADPQRPIRREELTQSEVLRKFGDLARTHRKRVVFMEFEYENKVNDDEIAAFNAHYAPYGEMVVLHIPKELTYDGQHLTAIGCSQVAGALLRHEAQRTQGTATR